MKLFRTITPIVILALLALALVACNSATPTPAPVATSVAISATATTPPTATAQPTATPQPSATKQSTATAQPSATTQASATKQLTATPLAKTTTTSPSAGYDGEWQGTNSEGLPLSFTVEKNQITYMLINYSYQAGNCSGGAGEGDGVKNAPISGDSFTATFTDSQGTIVTLVGKFSSATQAMGTFEVKGTAICGNTAFDTKDTWTAGNSSVAGTPTARPATVTPTVNANKTPPTSPTDVVMNFILGIDFDQVNEAVNIFVDDNVTYVIGATTGTGKAKLQAYFQNQVDQGVEYSFINGQITENGSVATFPLKVTGGSNPTTYNNCVATVKNGKITNLVFK